MSSLEEIKKSKYVSDVRTWAVEVTLGYLAQTADAPYSPEQVVNRAKVLEAYVLNGE